jgi:hypothetical protein
VTLPLAVTVLFCASFAGTILYAGWVALGARSRIRRGHPTRTLAQRRAR